MFQTNVEKIKTRILCSITVFKHYAIYEIMWENTVEPERPRITIWRMRIACWTPHATNTHSQYMILIYFPLKQWLHQLASMLRYTYMCDSYKAKIIDLC